MGNNLKGNVMRQLLKAQQGELDAVLMYKGLAESVKITELKEIFLNLAKDEGKHAAILRKITGKVLLPKKSTARIIKFIYRVFGLKVILKVLSNGEFTAAEKYNSFVEDYPELEVIRLDEMKHGEILRKFLLKL